MYLVFFCCWVGPVPYLEIFWAGPVKKVSLYILDIVLFIEFIDIIDFFLLGAEIGMHRALSQCQKKSGDALFDALHIFDALVHILETIVWTKITKMQFWLQSTLCWIKLFPRDCNSFSGENAQIAFYFHCAFFWSGAQKALNEKYRFFPAPIFSSIRKGFISAHVLHNSRMLNLLLDLQSLFALVISRVRC